MQTSPHTCSTVCGHGVPQPAITAALEALRQFFDLPPASKQALAHNSHAKGYMSWGQQTLDLAVQSCGDTKETWAVMGEAERQCVLWGESVWEGGGSALNVGRGRRGGVCVGRCVEAGQQGWQGNKLP